PWEKAKGFDGSAVISHEFIPLAEFDQPILFSLKKNQEVVQRGSSGDMIHNMDAIIAYVSQFMTLKIGDYIFTGTPSGVGPVTAGDQLEGLIQDRSMFRVSVR
ncbi:MAG: fumarylacetoacetate hydrolase family protein, partial [Flavobacteriales bacterium]